MDITIVTESMAELLLIMMAGFILARCGMLDEHTDRQLSSIIAQTTSPLLILSTALQSPSGNNSLVLLLVLCGFLLYGVLIVFARMLVHLLPVRKEDRPVYECMLVFSNCIFMGFPVLQSLLGDEAVFYCSMLHMPLNVYLYTYAVSMMQKAAAMEKGEAVVKKGFRSTLRSIITPGFLITLLALVLFLCNVRDDGFVYETVHMIGNVTSPLSMMLLGSSFARSPVMDSLKDRRAYGYSLLRLFVIPLASLGVCRLAGVSSYFTIITVLTLGMPCAAIILVFGNIYLKDPSLISRCIVVSTLLSILSIPVLVAVLNMV